MQSRLRRARSSSRARRQDVSLSPRTTTTSRRTCCGAAPRRSSRPSTTGRIGAARNLTMAVTHDHSSPYYSSTAWGAWTFQDVFDVRFYEYYAQQIADAVEQAAAHLKPVRVGAVGRRTLDKTHRNSIGPAMADDGTPAGYPNSDTDHDLSVVRFDDIATRRPKPLANLVNYSPARRDARGQRPDQRRLGRRRSQRMRRPRDRRRHDLHAERRRHHRARALAPTTDPRAARVHAHAVRPDRVRRAPAGRRDARDVARHRQRHAASAATRYVPFMRRRSRSTMDGPLVPGAGLAPLPGRVELPHRHGARRATRSSRSSACPTARTARACRRRRPVRLRTRRAAEPPIDPGLTTDDFERAGIPFPENYSAPSYSGLEETRRPPQAFRLGDILFTVCSCEQWADQARQHQDAHRPHAGQRVPRLRLGDAQCTTRRRRRRRGRCPDPRRRTVGHAALPTDLPTHERTSGCSAQVHNAAERLGRPLHERRRLRPSPSRPTRRRSGATTPTTTTPARRARLQADRADLDGQRLQRLHRDLPRVPARRPLPQGADRLGPALERLHGDAARGAGPRHAQRPARR